jgi:Cd2+/Zn2+-exporting ATPase
LSIAPPEEFAAITGMGVRASWDAEETLVGSLRLMERQCLIVPAQLRAQVEQMLAGGQGTVLVAWRGGRWLGAIGVADEPRPEVVAQLAALHAEGIERIVMLTGDNAQVATALAKHLGIDEAYAGLLPEEKLAHIESLRARYGAVAMVGDGVNDAPALAAADLGIAMGAAGTDAALETADIVLMRDDLAALAYARRLSRRTQRIVWQNIGFALAVMLVLVCATLLGEVSLPLGVLGHEGSTILVVLNGLRLLLDRHA